MIYIHAQNQGLHSHTIDIATATAKDFIWHYKLTNEATCGDSSTTIVEMPQKMALSLFWWYMDKEASSHLSTHLFDLLDHDEMKEDIISSVEYSVAKLTVDRNRKGFAGVVLTTAAEMASEIEDHIMNGHENELYALLDAKGFEKFGEVVA